MLPIGYGGCLLRSTPVRRHGVQRRGRDSPQRSSSVRGMMTHSVKKENLIVFILIRNNNNGWGERVERAEIVTWVSDISGYLEGLKVLLGSLCSSISISSASFRR